MIGKGNQILRPKGSRPRPRPHEHAVFKDVNKIADVQNFPVLNVILVQMQRRQVLDFLILTLILSLMTLPGKWDAISLIIFLSMGSLLYF